ncbi:FtsK/SpoIIIE domain-containing protein [Rhodococcus qingshengii]|uniref:FtsK/SpoIIIE domain-containing protein n=1 Tax=Rhodococcus qingshengii TaxID=334542 RepID=UPI003657A0BC
MSAGHSEPGKVSAAGLAARALVDALGDGKWKGRRLFLSDLHGMRPAEIFSGLLPLASESVSIQVRDDKRATLAGIPLQGGTLIPYLVTTQGAPTSDNSGEPGFAATLRTQFLAGPVEPRVLLVLAERPDETVTSASDDAASLPALRFSNLLKRLATERLGMQPAPRSLLAALIEDLGGRPVGSSGRERLEAFETLLAEHGGRDDRSFGTGLWRLGDYLCDPDATPQRLREGRKWRAIIEAALRNPARSLQGHLVAKRVTGTGAAKVAVAVGPMGVDWSQFQLSDLRAGAHPAVELNPHAPLSGSRLAFLGDGGCVIAWMPAGGGTVTFALNRELQPGESVQLRWPGTRTGIPAASSGNSASLLITDIQSSPGWRFGWLQLPDGGGKFGEPIPLAFTFSDKDTTAVEDGLSPDPGAGAFLCGEQPILRAWTASGRDLGLARVDEPETDPGAAGDELELPLLVSGTAPNGVRVGPVPVLAQRSSVGSDNVDQGYTAGDSSPGEQCAGPPLVTTEEEDTEEAEEDAADPLLDPSAAADTEAERDLTDYISFPHANHALHVKGWPEAGVNNDRQLSAKIGSYRVQVRPRLSGLDLVRVERGTHDHPEWAHYRVEASGGVSSLAELPEPESIWATEMASFRSTREAYFAAATAAGSAYAVDPLGAEATAYVDAYRDLLWALPREGMHRSEYYLLVTIDAVEVQGTRDLLISPMSPLSVAFHADLRRRLESATDATRPLGPGDLSAFSLQWSVPLLNHRGAWYEAIASEQAQLWRRYELLDEAAQGSYTRNAQFIANRIAFFLSVHPNLASADNRIAITFASPGDGRASIEALKRLMATEVGEETYRRPKIDVLLAGAKPEVHDTLAELFAGTDNPEAARIVRTRCNIRVTNSVQPEGFSHLTFLFRTPGGRTAGPVRMDLRSPSNYAGGLASKAGRILIPEAEPVFATGVFAAEPVADAGALERIQYRMLELVGGQGNERLVPRDTRMIRARASGRDLDAWYDSSAWVVHLDRMIGIEAFAEQRQAGRNILEYEDSADPATFGYDGITATQHVAPYLAALRQSIADLAALEEARGRALMSLLESVSGRWTLQIVQRPIRGVRERVGTACAVDFLTRAQQTLAPRRGEARALVALEELVPGFKESGIPVRYRSSRAGRGAMCDDLLLLSVTARPDELPVVGATVVEVKFSSLGGPNLPRAASQVEETNSWLTERFGSEAVARDLRGAELAELFRSASARNGAFGVGPGVDSVMESALADVSTGNYQFAIGHMRGASARRGLVISVEADNPGAPSLTQLNGQEGPLDLITLGRPWMQKVLTGEGPLGPEDWPTYESPTPGPPPPHPSTDEDSQRTPQEQREHPTNCHQAVPTTGSGPTGGSMPDASRDAVAEVAGRLNQAFARYGLPIQGFDPELAQVGPSLIRFRTRGQGKLAIADVERRARDLSREVEAPGQILIGDEPGFITVDVPRVDREAVMLSSVLSALNTPSRPGALDFVAGITPAGEVRTADLARLPHLLVAGATGSGKSVFLRGLLVELLRARTPDELQLLIVDPKRLDFAPFGSVPHLRGEIINDTDEALERLQTTLRAEIDLRQPILERAGASSAAEYYEAGGSLTELPQLVIVIDEFADLVLAGSDRRAFSEMIQRYAQLTRAYGIFLVLATQRPSVDVITGSIKANLTARIAFALPSYRDSMTILDRAGAEDLLGDGDLLFYRSGRTERLQAPFASLTDIRQVTS